MKRPGTRLRSLAARACDARTMERLIDPTLADLQAEYENAASRGRKWESRLVLVVGHLALLRVVTVHGGLQAMRILRNDADTDRRALIRTLGASGAIVFLGTVLLVMASFLNFVPPTHPKPAELAIYLVPQALPLSIPVGLTFGVLWGLGKAAASRRSRTIVLLLAVMASAVSFAMLAWVVPTANQAFRVSVIGRPARDVARGENELTLGELRQRLAPGMRDQAPVAAPSDVRRLALNYHGRWALAGAPLVLAGFAVALTSRRRWGLVMPLAGCLAIWGYYEVAYEARELALDRTLSAVAAAWAPNVAFSILSAAITLLGSPLAHGDASG